MNFCQITRKKELKLFLSLQKLNEYECYREYVSALAEFLLFSVSYFENPYTSQAELCVKQIKSLLTIKGQLKDSSTNHMIEIYVTKLTHYFISTLSSLKLNTLSQSDLYVVLNQILYRRRVSKKCYDLINNKTNSWPIIKPIKDEKKTLLPYLSIKGAIKQQGIPITDKCEVKNEKKDSQKRSIESIRKKAESIFEEVIKIKKETITTRPKKISVAIEQQDYLKDSYYVKEKQLEQIIKLRPGKQFDYRNRKKLSSIRRNRQSSLMSFSEKEQIKRAIEEYKIDKEEKHGKSIKSFSQKEVNRKQQKLDDKKTKMIRIPFCFDDRNLQRRKLSEMRKISLKL